MSFSCHVEKCPHNSKTCSPNVFLADTVLLFCFMNVDRGRMPLKKKKIIIVFSPEDHRWCCVLDFVAAVGGVSVNLNVPDLGPIISQAPCACDACMFPVVVMSRTPSSY